MRRCKICNKELLNRQKEYCSNKCKFSDESYNKGRGHTIENDPFKAIRHRETGKIYKDENNLSGVLSRYSEDVLGRPFDSSEWELIDVDIPKTIQCKECGWETKDLENRNGTLSIHIRKHHKPLTLQEYWNKYPDQKYLFKKQVAKVEKQEERDKVGIKCEECGKMLKKITVSHLRTHGMTPKEYREKYNIYNLSCDATRKKLSDLYQTNEALHKKRYVSKAEGEISNFINSLRFKTIRSYREFGFEIDVYIPDLNIGFEYNGISWHSESLSGKPKDYHFKKSIKSFEKGVFIYHIFENFWRGNKDGVLSFIKNVLNTSSFKLNPVNIKRVSISQFKDLYKQNSLQLFEKVKDSIYYLVEDSGGIVLGGFSFKSGVVRNVFQITKLQQDFNILVNFIVDSVECEIVDLPFHCVNPKSLELDGFSKSLLGDCNYFYTRNHGDLYIRDKVLLKNKSKFDPSLTEWENMQKLGFDRIWDCGSLKYEKLYR